MPRWTEEARAKQREAIMKSEPWKKITDPQTIKGKAISSCNAMKHGLYTQRGEELLRLLAAQSRYVRTILRSEAPRVKTRGITASRVTYGHNSSFACPNTRSTS